MRRVMLIPVLWTLALSGCFDDAVTVGLDCENDLECGEGQACGPDELEDDEETPGQVCGVPQDEGWDPCKSTDASTCDDFETVLTCRNGFETKTNCDAACEAQVGGLRHDGVCGPEVPGFEGECACAYVVLTESPHAAKDCLQSAPEEGSLELVRSAFGSDDVAVYLQTCDEWCKERSPIPTYSESACIDTFAAVAADAVGEPFATALRNRAGGEPCVCRLEEEPDCSGDQPTTRCLDSTTVVLCTTTVETQVHCSNGCGPVGAGPVDFNWCL